MLALFLVLYKREIEIGIENPSGIVIIKIHCSFNFRFYFNLLTSKLQQICGVAVKLLSCFTPEIWQFLLQI